MICNLRVKKTGKKIIKCIDCGLEFQVDKSVKRKDRCDECYEKHRKETKLKTWNKNKDKYIKDKN